MTESVDDQSTQNDSLTSSASSGVSAFRLRRFLAHRWAECVLAVIIISSTALSTYWVFKVPILQAPDEDSHIDYAFSIYSAGRLLNVRTPPSEWNVHAVVQGADFERISHQYTLYLIDTIDFQRLRYEPFERVSAEYGSLDYYKKLDLNSPKTPARVPDLTPQDNPWLITAYPFGYYALVAAWLRVIDIFTNSVIALFFSARLLSVLLLAGSLVLVYATLRELAFSKTRALVLTFIVAFFPLTTFESSAVQPDNLAFLLVLLCFYSALVLRRQRSGRPWMLPFLAVALGALAVTKYQFFFFTAVSIVGMLVSEHVFRRGRWIDLARKVVILFLPFVLFFGIQTWVVWGGKQLTGSNLRRSSVGLLTGISDAVTDYYGGTEPFKAGAFESWWGNFGWMDAPLLVHSFSTQRRLLWFITAITLVMVALTIFRLEQVTTRLVLLARKGRWRWALRSAMANPLVTGYLLFSVFMVLLYALTDNSFFAQGRHWFPYLLSSFVITTQYAPRALSHRRTQSALSKLLLMGLLLYCLVGSCYAVYTISERYYGGPDSVWGS